jgi:hypothetical protein
MWYEWDDGKAGRRFLFKFASAWLITVALSFLPVWWLVQEAVL